ncbi:MAG: antifreeze protein [Phyllobacterium sp.]|uniref:antifreeze protein n=1 Tax=Phyllobacterium sp. TaxID=1871046 RepID=UPI0030F11C01
MASLSLKLLAVGAAISIGAILGANTSNAAPLAASPAVVELGAASAPLVQVDYRYGHYRPPYRPAACTPGQAASKASRMGIRDPRVSENRNVVRVSGWKRGLRTAVVFARAPGCPIIR